MNYLFQLLRILGFIKYSLRLVWPMSIITLLGATLLGVIPF